MDLQPFIVTRDAIDLKGVSVAEAEAYLARKALHGYRLVAVLERQHLVPTSYITAETVTHTTCIWERREP